MTDKKIEEMKKKLEEQLIKQVIRGKEIEEMQRKTYSQLSQAFAGIFESMIRPYQELMIKEEDKSAYKEWADGISNGGIIPGDVKTAGGLSVNIVHRASIDELVNASPSFSFLRNCCLPENNTSRWNRGGVDTHCLQVMFIGKTGYGKSTTLNRICGQTYFKTDTIESCTKQLYSSEYKLNPYREQYLSFCDLPGIGESLRTDPHYIQWYAQMVSKSACIVYLLRVDQRDFSVDEEIIKLLRENNSLHKTIVGLNYADKIEPVTRVSNQFQPNNEQMSNLENKRTITSQVLQIPLENSIYYSATDGYNINRLLDKIAEILKNSGI